MSGVFIVDVGGDPTSPNGFTFSPNTVNATSGSTITFRFSGSPGNHSVTQSSFDQPCTPLPGGLDSGFQAVPAGTTSGFFQWSFVVENDEQPLWFFCRQFRPTSPHCFLGMLFNLNPSADTGIGSFDDFRLAAQEFKTITTTETDDKTAIVTTLLAFQATSTPLAVPISTFVLSNNITTTVFSTLVQTTAPPTATGNVKAVQISAIDGVTTVFGFEDADLVDSATSVTPTATTSGQSETASQSETVFSSQPGGTFPSQSGSVALLTREKHVPVAAIVGSIFGVLTLISLCVAAIFIHRHRVRRASQGRIRELGRRTESGIIHMDRSEEDLSARPDPLIRYPDEKSLPLVLEDATSPDSSSTTLPVAAEFSTVTLSVEEQMQALRMQVQRLELERQALGVGAPNDPPPPEYAPG
ncbi:hypothetical protein DFH07DRAFT_925747 [Mycena maculata]|uniref:Extracellular serine-rich protein n=1 Tax=Mycena maculata TaxID=230809 RepID=A0AAD7IFT8_9AGAR|nr:hypothetical protein DFH07DRAFT_925747 [Mycena maculata]